MRLRRLTLPGAVALLAVASASSSVAQHTRPERTGNHETSSYDDVLMFLDSLQSSGAGFRRGVLGWSPEGRAIPYLIVAHPMVSAPGDAHRSGKPIIYLQANIHAGEVEGKESAQMLVRDLTIGSLSPLLDSVILLVVPIYNADGNERRAPSGQNRPGQNGPDVVGINTNGQGLNLNRDYVKLEAPETRAALALLNAWEPDFFIDLHTTNGSYHGYALTYAPGLNPNSPPANVYLRDHFLPIVRERMRLRHHEETFWYGNFRNQEPDSLVLGWETFDPRPRFGTNAMAMRGRLAILSEGYSNAPFGERIAATYTFVLEILHLAAEERGAVMAALARSARFAPESIAVRSALAPANLQDVIAELTLPAGEGSHGFAKRERTGVYRTIRMPVFDRFVPARQVARPAGYLLPPAMAEIVALLRAQGIVTQRLSTAWDGPVEAFVIDSVVSASALFEGHRVVSLEGRWTLRNTRLPAGWYYVPTNQRDGVFAAYLLEPESEDGLVTWNLLDRTIGVGGEYPILRTRSEVSSPLETVP